MSCTNCGESFKPSNKKQQFCSSKCRYQHRDAKNRIPCAVCGEPMYRGRTVLPEGQATHNRCRVTHGATRYVRHNCRCDVCRSGAAKAARDFRAGYKQRNGKGYKAPSVLGGQYYQGHWTSDAMRYAIYARDNWVCQLCHQPVEKGLDGSTDRMAATLDHIHPLSKGGAHTVSNLQLAHRACNSAKCDRLVA